MLIRMRPVHSLCCRHNCIPDKFLWQYDTSSYDYPSQFCQPWRHFGRYLWVVLTGIGAILANLFSQDSGTVNVLAHNGNWSSLYDQMYRTPQTYKVEFYVTTRSRGYRVYMWQDVNELSTSNISDFWQLSNGPLWKHPVLCCVVHISSSAGTSRICII